MHMYVSHHHMQDNDGKVYYENHKCVFLPSAFLRFFSIFFSSFLFFPPHLLHGAHAEARRQFVLRKSPVSMPPRCNPPSLLKEGSKRTPFSFICYIFWKEKSANRLAQSLYFVFCFFCCFNNLSQFLLGFCGFHRNIRIVCSFASKLLFLLLSVVVYVCAHTQRKRVKPSPRKAFCKRSCCFQIFLWLGLILEDLESSRKARAWSLNSRPLP